MLLSMTWGTTFMKTKILKSYDRLRGYQRDDVDFIVNRSSTGVFNEQRTGKTPTSIVAASIKTAGRILIVCPSSLLYNWKQEFELWSDGDCQVYYGTKKARQDAIDNWTRGLVISYDLFKNIKGRIGALDLILALKPQVMIVDEAHRFQGRKSANFKAMKYAATRVPYKIALTGTPAPNRQDQVWAILHFLEPKEYSSYWRWIDLFFETEDVRLSAAARQAVGKDMIAQPTVVKERLQNLFINQLSALSIQRKRIDIMTWLPALPTPTKIKLPLTSQQNKYLKELDTMFETEHVIVEGVLDRLIRYRQICNAPALLNLKGKSPKIEWLSNYIKDYPDEPAIIFSRFTGFINLIKWSLGDSVEIMVGATPPIKRKRLVDDFQQGKIKKLIIQLDVGKEGLTLDRAEALIFLDMYPPAGDNAQARDRIVATNEGMAKIPTKIIELMMADSYDELLYEAVERNLSTTEIINNYNKYREEIHNVNNR